MVHPVKRFGVRVHPHASGDSGLDAGQLLGARGSPPREWGQHLAMRFYGTGQRFTPTRVGTA